MTDDYVSYEIAKLLKEKGFDATTIFYYDKCGIVCPADAWVDAYKDEYYPFITLSLAMKWLREKGIFIEISIIITNEDKVYYHASCGTVANCWKIISEWNASYEEAVEAALKYSLENLI